jgi:hypothetical protein
LKKRKPSTVAWQALELMAVYGFIKGLIPFSKLFYFYIEIFRIFFVKVPELK